MSTPLDDLHTLRDWLRYAVSRFEQAGLFYGHGSDNAYDEAAYLLLHALHLPPDTLDPFLDARLLPAERATLQQRIEQRVTDRLPAPYITGEAWLRGRRFVVSPDVLVPRSPLAALIDAELAPWLPAPEHVSRVLDMCTGSGCLAILAAQIFGHAQVDAADVSDKALAVCARNIADYGLEDQVQPWHSDLFDNLPPVVYDVILCNPPYVNAASMDSLPAEYRHEPALALAGGDDGMQLVARILRDAPRFLSHDGLLFLEIGHERAYFEAAFPDLDVLWLETDTGPDQVLLLTRTQLDAWQAQQA